jgi:hypothetical protein
VIAELTLDGRANFGAGREDLPSPTVNAAHTMILGNDISNSQTRVCIVLGSIRGYGAAISPVVAGNRIHNCGVRSGTDGLQTTNNQHGVYVEHTYGARIVHNAIFDNADRGIQLYPAATGSRIFHNLILGNGQGVIFSGAEGFSSAGNLVIANAIAQSRIRSNIEHYWEAPSRPGTGNAAVRNCLGGAREGNVALPVLGYVARGNTAGDVRLVNRAAGDLRLARGSGCQLTLRSGLLPWLPFA